MCSPLLLGRGKVGGGSCCFSCLPFSSSRAGGRQKGKQQTTETVFLFQGQVYLNNLQPFDSLKGCWFFFSSMIKITKILKQKTVFFKKERTQRGRGAGNRGAAGCRAQRSQQDPAAVTPDRVVGRGEELPPALLSAGAQEGCRGKGGACRSWPGAGSAFSSSSSPWSFSDSTGHRSQP